MATPKDNALILDRFSAVVARFCSVVDSAPNLERSDFVAQLYRTLPKLIDEAISLPEVERINRNPTRKTVRQKIDEWDRLYTSLKQKLGDWDSYMQVFDPTRDTAAIPGSLADDIADIYRDLKERLVLKGTHGSEPEELIWEWKFGFQSHWGKHAMDALLAIHFRVGNDETLQQ